MKLYTYWRSSAAYRVRIALNLKSLTSELFSVHLVKNGGEQLQSAYQAINHQGLVPTLEVDSGEVITQSLAIMEYLDEAFSKPALLPENPLARARVRSIAQVIACDIHPLNNLRVLKYLTGELGVSDEEKKQWYQHWISLSFTSLERQLANSNATGLFCHGDIPSIADACLVPQIYNARRFLLDMANFPTLKRIEENCQKLEAFQLAAPEAQEDAQ